MLRGLRLSTQSYLFGLGAAIVAPLLLLAGLLVFRYAAFETQRVEQQAERLAFQINLILEAQLERGLSLLRGLAASSALARGDHAEFYQEALRVSGSDDMIILLRDLDTRQLLNTQLPYGAELPPAIELTAAERAQFLSGRPHISDVYRSPITGETRFAISLPVRRDGEVRYLLALTLPTSRIRNIIRPATPPNWIVGIGDRKGVYVARSEKHEEVTGKSGLQSYLDKAAGKFGSFRSSNFEGVALVAGYHRSDLSGWLVAANVPETVVSTPFRRSLRWLAAAGACALALSMLLAYMMGRRFNAATRGLTEQALALREGRPVLPLHTHLSDLALVGEALVAASIAIRQREKERALLTNELNHRVKNTLATIQSIAHHTLRDGTSVADARRALLQRLVALSRAHDVLTAENWEGATIADTVAAVTSAFGGAERFTATGEEIWLQPGMSLALSLTLSELATNAAKYGALSAPDGRIDIRWRKEDSPGGPLAKIHWQEHGGPPVQSPQRRGFGSTLIESAFSSTAGAKVELRYETAGLVCEICAPLGAGSGAEARHTL